MEKEKMSNIIIKESKHKITHPTDDPMWEKKKKIAERRIKEGKMTFASEAEERDYNRRVSASKFNIKGLPALYPPDKIKPLCIGDIPDMTDEDCKRMEEEEKRIASIKDIDLECSRCEKITSHSVSPVQVFCHDCGMQRPDYLNRYEELIKLTPEKEKQ
jgi:hypothetical protein